MASVTAGLRRRPGGRRQGPRRFAPPGRSHRCAERASHAARSKAEPAAPAGPATPAGPGRPAALAGRAAPAGPAGPAGSARPPDHRPRRRRPHGPSSRGCRPESSRPPCNQPSRSSRRRRSSLPAAHVCPRAAAVSGVGSGAGSGSGCPASRRCPGIDDAAADPGPGEHRPRGAHPPPLTAQTGLIAVGDVDPDKPSRQDDHCHGDDHPDTESRFRRPYRFDHSWPSNQHHPPGYLPTSPPEAPSTTSPAVAVPRSPAGHPALVMTANQPSAQSARPSLKGSFRQSYGHVTPPSKRRPCAPQAWQTG